MASLRLSIIVPVFNVEGYLHRCLETCSQQDISLDEYEIIIVNDGSTDQSLSIAEEFAVRNPNVRVYSQENGGLSKARNVGLEKAQGEYVWFVDSDDFIAKNCLNSLLHKCQTMGLDLLAFCTAKVTEMDVTESHLFGDGMGELVLDGPTAMSKGLIKKMGAPLFIIRKAFLDDNGLRFTLGIMHEDEEFVPIMYYLASRVSFTSRICYYVYVRTGSIMRTVNPQRLKDLLTVMNSLYRFSKTIAKCHRYLFSQRIALLIDSSFKLCRRMPEEEGHVFEGMLRENMHLVRQMVRSRQLRFQVAGMLLLCFPKHMVDVYNVLLKMARR